jgi:biotin carboxylase
MGARGVSLAQSPETVAAAFRFAKAATPSGEVVIEEYMEGPELSIDALVHNGTVTVCGIADRLIAYPPYFVETGHIMPSNQPADALADAVRVMENGMRALGLTLGAAKGDIKLTPRGAMVGEIAARLSGGFMSAFTYPYASGVDLIGNAIRIALGEAPGDLRPSLSRVSMEAAIIPAPGTVREIRRIDEVLRIPGIRHLFLNVDIGDRVIVPRSNVEKAGHLIAVADDRDQVQACIEQALATLEIVTGP